MSTICVFGDSTAWGAWDLEKGGWVNRLWLYLGIKGQYNIELYNLSITGGTTRTILTRFENEAKIRGADILIFQTGGNDAAFDNLKGGLQILPDEFISNIEEIIKRAKKIAEKIVIIGFKNVDETKTKPVPWDDISYINENIKKYNKMMNEVCAQRNVSFLDVFGLLENSDLEDGVHPNAKGHQKIYEKTKDFLENQGML